MPGNDTATNVDAHLEYFLQEGIRLCQVWLDLARQVDAALIPILLKRKFDPCLLLPGGADGDLMILERPIHGAKGAA